MFNKFVLYGRGSCTVWWRLVYCKSVREAMGRLDSEWRRLMVAGDSLPPPIYLPLPSSSTKLCYSISAKYINYQQALRKCQRANFQKFKQFLPFQLFSVKSCFCWVSNFSLFKNIFFISFQLNICQTLSIRFKVENK